jgi:hypothetical protein
MERDEGQARFSRQRKYQIKHRAEGLCGRCSEPAIPSTRKGVKIGAYCLKHAIAVRESYRKRMGQSDYSTRRATERNVATQTSQ